MFAAGTLLALVATACGDGPSGSSSGSSSGASVGSVANGQTANSTVNETDANVFQPATITVKVGQIVEWKNTGSVTHNVTFKQYDDITSTSMSGGATWSIKFTTPGSYDYVCTIHEGVGMKGSVTVTS